MEEELPLISEQYQYPQDSEEAENRDDSQSPVSRTIVVAAIVGIIVIFGALITVFVGGIGGGGEPVAQEEKEKEDSAFEEDLQQDEAARYKTDLALIDQQGASEEEDKPKTPEQQQAVSVGNTPSEQEQESTTPSTSPPTTSTSSSNFSSSSSSTPQPEPLRTVESFSPSTLSNNSTPEPTSSFSPPEPEDPLERWNALASLGEQSAVLQEAEAVEEANNNNLAAPSRGQGGGDSKRRSVSQVTLGSLGTSNRRFSSKGARGIINRRRVENILPKIQRYQIPIGSTARGEVSVPVIWSGGEASSLTQGRFTITLTEPLRSPSGDVALPRGTVIVTQANSVASNGLVSQFPIAIAYRDHHGKLIQQQIPPDTFSIRGENNAPLVAQTLQDPGGAIAQQDLLIGLLGAGARATEIINEPEEEIIEQRDTRFSSTSRRSTTQEDKNILAAAIEGFFGITRDRLTERSQQTTQELLNRQPIWVVEQGTEVAVVVNSFLEVNR